MTGHLWRRGAAASSAQRAILRPSRGPSVVALETDDTAPLLAYRGPMRVLNTLRSHADLSFAIGLDAPIRDRLPLPGRELHRDLGRPGHSRPPRPGLRQPVRVPRGVLR